MSDSIIEVKGISKQYSIGQRETGYLVLSEILGNLAKKLISRKISKHNKSNFWALKNVSFEVKEGEILGIIGPNGAGKSTLLKILSRITPPTRGEIRLRGRIASLLEVGTGFHPELTGRENIFLNGAILGMTRQEVKSKLEEIVDFSGVEKFIDTPIKHYSSGMQVRLAFSIAAHLEPDILLVDEVLAVGDAQFQKKSLGKMDSVSREGRTVLFVSHNLSAITSLCQRAFLLKDGKIVTRGNPENVMAEYLKKGYGLLPEVVCPTTKNFENEFMKMVRIRAHDTNNLVQKTFDIRNPIGIDINYQLKHPNVSWAANIQLVNSNGILLFNSPEQIDRIRNGVGEGALFRSTCWIPGNFLAEGLFSVRATLTIFEKGKLHEIDFRDAVTFNVYDSGEVGSVKGKSHSDFPGVIRPKLKWERMEIDNLNK